MSKRLFKTLVAVLAIAAAATGPVRAQNENVSWVLTPYGNLQTGDTVVIVDKTSARALPKPASSSSAPGTISVTLNSAKDTLTSTPGATLKWVVVRDGNNYKFRKPGTDNEYLYFTDADNGVRVGNSENSQFSFENGGTYNVPFLKNNATSRYFGLTDANLWRSPTSTTGTSIIKNTVIGFYKKTVIPTHTVTFAEGTEDVGNWSFTPAEAATNTGVTAGTVVTVKYNGTSRINSIELKSKMLITPLTIEALTAGTVKVQSPKSGMQYTLNGGTKTPMTESPTEITVAVGDKVAFYGNGTSITSYNGTIITGSGNGFTCKVYGNIMSLVDETGFATAKTLSESSTFYGLFYENTTLTDASGLLLPAETLASSCYYYMFRGCTGLTTAPALPAETLAESCYNQMFRGCTSLTTAPALPATQLATSCYRSMFMGCTALTTAPVLPATQLIENCYYQMFINCSKLATVTCLATSGINTNSSTDNWLRNAGTDQSVTTMTFNAASPVNWPTNSVSGIPSGWTLVTPAHTPLTLEALTDGTIKVQSPQSGMQYTLNGGAKTPVTSAAITVAAGDKVAFYGNGTSITSYDGTTIAGGTADVKVYGNIMSLVDEENFATATTLSVEYQFYNLFSENNHLKDASGLLLPATTLAPTCYAYMFHYCSSLTAAPAELPATTLAEACYRGMFQDCMSLTTAPELPAQTLVSYCYAHMFQLCTKLNSVTCLATSGINQNGSTESWLDYAGTDQSVTTKTFNAASTAEWPTSVHGIPEGWTLGAQSTPEPVTLVPTGNTNEWTLTMPADNMLLMVNYAPAHTVRFADGNNGWQVQDVTAATSATAPAVLQNVIAGDSLVVTAPASLPGKVKSVKAVKYVAPAATVTTAPTATAGIIEANTTTALVNAGAANGGTMMYAVTTTNVQPASTADFSATRPTAQGRTAGTYYVWFYAKADAEHSDSEIAGPVSVPLALTLTWNSSNISDLRVSGTFQSYTKEGITLSANADMNEAEWYDYGDESMNGIEFQVNQSVGFTFTAPTGKKFTKIEMTLTGPAGWNLASLGTGWAYGENFDPMTMDEAICKATWTGSAASTVGLLTGANMFMGERANSIVFTLIDAQ